MTKERREKGSIAQAFDRRPSVLVVLLVVNNRPKQARGHITDTM